MMDVRSLARLLDGEVKNSSQVTCPGPGHSRKDRSLSVKIDPNAPDGFLVHSHAGDDWLECRNYVRRKLGLPDWQPGDGQNRSIPQSKIEKWDLAMTDAEGEAMPQAWTEDELLRINAARRIWDEGVNPRRTLRSVT
jgi:hypothetical protein